MAGSMSYIQIVMAASWHLPALAQAMHMAALCATVLSLPELVRTGCFWWTRSAWPQTKDVAELATGFAQFLQWLKEEQDEAVSISPTATGRANWKSPYRARSLEHLRAYAGPGILQLESYDIYRISTLSPHADVGWGSRFDCGTRLPSPCSYIRRIIYACILSTRPQAADSRRNKWSLVH